MFSPKRILHSIVKDLPINVFMSGGSVGTTVVWSKHFDIPLPLDYHWLFLGVLVTGFLRPFLLRDPP